MQGLMQPYPLTLVHPFERAERLFPDKPIVLGDADRGPSAPHTGRGHSVLAASVACSTSSGISADGRVGTFAWNSARHLELYFAAPCSGRVLHTLNIRLFPEQLQYVADHARGRGDLRRPLAAEAAVAADRRARPPCEHVVVMDDGVDDELPDDERIRDYETLLAAAQPVDFHVADENSAAAMCYTSGTTGNPKGVVYSPPLECPALHELDVRRHARASPRPT